MSKKYNIITGCITIIMAILFLAAFAIVASGCARPSETMTSAPQTESIIETTLAEITTETESEVESTEESSTEEPATETETETDSESFFIYDFAYYYVQDNGDYPEQLSEELQEFAQVILLEWNMVEYYELWLCQAYLESRFRMSCKSGPHGGYYDYGIMQIWEGLAHDKYSPMYETLKLYPNYKTDPYENIYCGLVQLRQWYDIKGDFVQALGCYLTGTSHPSQSYIDKVLAIKPKLHRYK